MFRFFRRYQKSLLVVAGVLCMLAFTVGDSLSMLLGGGGNDREGRNLSEVAVTWDGGKLTRGELGDLMQQRRDAANFMIAIYQVGNDLAPEGVLDLVIPFIPSTNTRTFPEETVQTHILANEARQMGMTISDETIAKYLAELGLNQVGATEMRGMVDAMSSQRQGRITIDYIFNAIREEMLAGLLRSSYRYAVSAEMPQERYQEWLEANDEIFIEAVGIPVTESLVDVGEPTDEELKELFDKYKDTFPRPVNLPGGVELPQPNPAFGNPRRVTLQYLRANYETIRDQIASSFTDEEVEKYYEENPSLFMKSDFGADDEGTSTDEAGVDETDAAESEEMTEESTPDEPASTLDTPESTIDPSAEEPATEEPATKEATTDATEEARRDESASLGLPSPFRLVAMQQEVTDDENEAESTPARVEGGAAEADDAVETSDDETNSLANVELKPLAEVADEIRETLANAKVQERIDEVTDKVYNQLTVDFRAYQGKVLDAEGSGKPIPVPPVSLTDLNRLAAEYGLEYEKTKPVSMFELRDDVPVGLSQEQLRTDRESYESLVVNVVFSETFDDYEPIRSVDAEGNSYITMRTADEPQSVPKFEDVRDEVVRAWKLQRAAEIATKRAEELAAKISQADVSLKDYFADDPNREVLEPTAFAKITPGGMSPTSFMVDYRLSQPEGLQAIGPEFITKVFEAEPGDVLAIENFDRSIAYVVRVKSHLETPEKLRETFLTETDSWLGRRTMLQANRSAAQQRLFGDLFDAKKIEWQIDLNQGDQ